MASRKLYARLVIWIVIIAAAAGGITWYFLRGKGEEEAKYRTEALDRGDITMAVTATGTISAVTTVQVGSQVSGIIARLHADYNSPVKQGQLLAELDPTTFEAQVEQRRADLLQNEVQTRNAGIDFRRQERLFAEKLASEADYDAAKANFEAAQAQVEQARAALRQAETSLKYTKIHSPIDGVVVDRKYDVGQTVAASFQAPTLFTIAQDLTKMQVQADVDQSDIGRVKKEQLARFTVDAYPDQQFEGRISQIRLNATVNQNVITYPVILEVPNPEGKLRPQMTANVSIEVAQVRNVLRVPNAALRFRPAPTDGEKKAAVGEKPAGGAGRDAGGAKEAGAGGEKAASGGKGAGSEETAGSGKAAGSGDAAGGGPLEGGAGEEATAARGAAGAPAAGAASSGVGKEGGRSRRPGVAPGAGAGGSEPGGAQAGTGTGVEEKMARLERPEGGLAGAAMELGAAAGQPAAGRREQTVYLLVGANELKPVKVRTGITDGRFTQVLGGEIKPGDAIVIGQVTSKVEQGTRPPGGGRMF